MGRRQKDTPEGRNRSRKSAVGLEQRRKATSSSGGVGIGKTIEPETLLEKVRVSAMVAGENGPDEGQRQTAE